ncbi:solute carrier organic anion transporter [Comamonas sp. CAH-2]|jgi:hypothetical protein|nr:solute carrier organic anion transporter [Comamonas sp. CAH-2]
MIGISFLAVGLFWVWLSWFLASHLPKWIGIATHVGQRVLTVAVFMLLMVVPFVDHIVGMRQFERLCAEETGLQIFPKVVDTKRGVETSSARELVGGTAIPISRSVSTISDLDTGEVIARYNHFTTRGGVIGGLPMLGGEHVCSIDGPRHPKYEQYRALKKQIHLTYGQPE